MKSALVLVGIIDVIGALLMWLFEDDLPRSEIHNLWDSFFFTTVQLLTVSSQMRNPISTGGRIIDIFLELTALCLVSGIAGVFASFFLNLEADEERTTNDVSRVGSRLIPNWSEFMRRIRGVVVAAVPGRTAGLTLIDAGDSREASVAVSGGLGGAPHELGVLTCQDRVERRVLGLDDRRRREGNRVDGVGLGPVGFILGDVGVDVRSRARPSRVAPRSKQRWTRRDGTPTPARPSFGPRPATPPRRSKATGRRCDGIRGRPALTPLSRR